MVLMSNGMQCNPPTMDVALPTRHHRQTMDDSVPLRGEAGTRSSPLKPDTAYTASTTAIAIAPHRQAGGDSLTATRIAETCKSATSYGRTSVRMATTTPRLRTPASRRPRPAVASGPTEERVKRESAHSSDSSAVPPGADAKVPPSSE